MCVYNEPRLSNWNIFVLITFLYLYLTIRTSLYFQNFLFRIRYCILSNFIEYISFLQKVMLGDQNHKVK